MEPVHDNSAKKLGKSGMRLKKRAFWLLPLLLLLYGGISRPDIRVAMSMIENAYRYAEGDTRVMLATNYLIWTEHPITYGELRNMFWNCRNLPREAPTDPYDYTAIQAAEILGSYTGDQAMDALVDILSRDYAVEGPPGCAIHAIDGLTIKGDVGYLVIEAIATGEFTRIRTFRLYAIKTLGETMNPNYKIVLEDILQVEKDEFLRTTIADILNTIAE